VQRHVLRAVFLVIALTVRLRCLSIVNSHRNDIILLSSFISISSPVPKMKGSDIEHQNNEQRSESIVDEVRFRF
jgi:hypothetical protein